MSVVSLDPLDRRIMAVLAGDARKSFADIGEVVGLSASAVKRRVDRLRASGTIMGYTAVFDPGALGWNTEAYVEIYCRRATSPGRIADAVGRHPEVVAAMTVTGDADALLRIRAADIRHFEECSSESALSRSSCARAVTWCSRTCSTGAATRSRRACETILRRSRRTRTETAARRNIRPLPGTGHPS